MGPLAQSHEGRTPDYCSTNEKSHSKVDEVNHCLSTVTGEMNQAIEVTDTGHFDLRLVFARRLRWLGPVGFGPCRGLGPVANGPTFTETARLAGARAGIR